MRKVIQFFLRGLIILCFFLKPDAYAASAAAKSKSQSSASKANKDGKKKSQKQKGKAKAAQKKQKSQKDTGWKVKVFAGMAQAALARDGYDHTRRWDSSSKDSKAEKKDEKKSNKKQAATSRRGVKPIVVVNIKKLVFVQNARSRAGQGRSRFGLRRS